MPRLPARLAAAITMGCAALVVQAQSVSLGGVMGRQAMLVIDGQTRVMVPGASVDGVRLLSVGEVSAEVEVQGRRRQLSVGGLPIQLAARTATVGTHEIVLPAGPGGHFFAQGSINGKSIVFMVDTGATSVAISHAQAMNMGLDLRDAKRAMALTANGPVASKIVTLRTVRINDVEVHNVEAMVVPMPMDHALLGNSFLTRFSMVRHNDVMRLTKR